MDSRSMAPDWTIERILSEQPAAIPVLLSHRLACVGCYMTMFCTLDDAKTCRDQQTYIIRHSARCGHLYGRPKPRPQALIPSATTHYHDDRCDNASKRRVPKADTK